MRDGAVAGLASAAALVLGGIFAWAALAKLRDVGATAAGFAGLRLPGPAVLARLVPAVELVLAAALVLVPSVAAGAAIVLLAAFTALLVRELLRGSTAGCNCFGSGRATTPISAQEPVRNVLLAALAVLATGAPSPVRFDLASIVLVSTAAALAAVALAVAQLRARVGHVWDNTLGGEARGE